MVNGRFLLSSLPGFANNGLHGWAKLVRGRGDGRTGAYFGFVKHVKVNWNFGKLPHSRNQQSYSVR